MEHQSDEDGKKWAQQLNNPLPGQPSSPDEDRESLAQFRKMM